MFGFSKQKPKPKRSSSRQTGGKQAKALAELQTQLDTAEQQIRLKDAEIESRDTRIAILEETINVLRDCLGAQQITAQVHTAEGKILLNDLGRKADHANGIAPIHR